LLLSACGGGSGSDGAATTSAPAVATGSGDGGVTLTEIGEFDAPLYVTQPPGESEGLYVVEQGGRVIRVAPDGATSTFLDISGDVKAGGEQGLLSVAFSPGFARDGLVYADYTDTEGDTRVVEFHSADGGETADPASARELLAIDQPYENHNGGLLEFGLDGRLYVGLGDGGSAGDPERRGLDLTTPLGKILRIDPSADGSAPYTIPPDNPFAGRDGVRREIYSYGLRNPWRFSFDRPSGSIVIADVGQESQEEVDVLSARDASGANFGWSAFEGAARFNDDQPADDAVAPDLTLSHDDGFCSITGGYVVRDERLKSLYGRYVYGDFCRPELRSFDPSGGGARDDHDVGISVPDLSSFGTDREGRVYATSIAGPVYRLDPRG
jgi:glucose/arabinose dehydrogenase